jgi:NAD(P)-dependent dehydrogenase (short-subunit alcohol dehydrogenase family)
MKGKAMSVEFDLSGQVVIVTGGGKGVGRGISTRFLEAGADVVICGRSELDSPVEAGGRKAHFRQADVRDVEQVGAVVEYAKRELGRLDVLVNNAGGAPPAESSTASPNFNAKVIALNLTSALTFSQAAHGAMADSGGVILNISSVSGTRTNPGGAAYGAAKAGLANMGRTLAHEWGPAIRVVTVTVGMIVTDEGAAFYGDGGRREAIGGLLAAGRMGEPEDVADMCLVLASPLARWVTGTEVEVHGGDERPGYLDVISSD